MTRTSRARRYVGVLAALAALSATACSGDEDPAPDADEPTASLSEPTAAPTLEVEPVVKSGTIVGRLPRQDRARVEKAVSSVAVTYLEAAYLLGDYPRQDFRNAYPGFTTGTAKRAFADRKLLTNSPIGQRIDGVTPLRIEVKVDLLAVGKRAVAATDRFELVFRTSGKLEKRYRVAGELRLTKRDGRWKVFAYDVTKGAR